MVGAVVVQGRLAGARHPDVEWGKRCSHLAVGRWILGAGLRNKDAVHEKYKLITRVIKMDQMCAIIKL